MSRMMVMCFVFFTLMTGCDYSVPLVQKPAEELDDALTGLWQRTGENGNTEHLLVLPLNKHEILVSFPAGSDNAMFARGCLWRSGAMQWVQLDWIGTARGKLPEDNRTFQYASCTVEGNTLKIRLLNPEVVSKDIESSEGLIKAITDHKDNPKLFRDEIGFLKVKN